MALARGGAATSHESGRRTRWRVVVAGVVVAVGVLALVDWLRPDPPDGFYQLPEGVASLAPGTLLRIESVDAAPAGADAWRILYRSTDHAGQPAAVSGLLFAPRDAAGDLPLVAVAHGSTGIGVDCAPSLSSRPLASMPPVEEALAAGFAVVATDYLGLGIGEVHPYMVGEASAHAVLDSVRAAQQVLAVDADRVALWGYSQGGHAVLFAAEHAAVYAPEIELRGVVALAPAIDLDGVIRDGHGTVLGTLLLVTTAVSWSEIYPDLDLADVVDDASFDDARQIAGRCLDPTSLPASVIDAIVLRDALSLPDGDATRRWSHHIASNTPRAPAGVEVLVVHGADDRVLDAQASRSFVAEACTASASVELWTVDGAGHLTLVNRVSPDVVEWTGQRFAGVDAAGCAADVDEAADRDTDSEPELPDGVSHRPAWLGTRPLELRDDGLGVPQPTPPELQDRRFVTVASLPPPADGRFSATNDPVPDGVAERSTWHPGCPVTLDELRYLTVVFHGFDGRDHTGELIVHRDHAEQIVEVFATLHEARFPIEQMGIATPEDLEAHPTGDGNLTNGFVCRDTVSGQSWSEHAYGRAIDINPFHNPYVRGDVVVPELAASYLDRDDHRPGMIQPGDEVVRAFADIGWHWGGNWRSAKDWMHFSATGR